MGVRGIALGDGDKLISLTILRHLDRQERYAQMSAAEQFVLTISENGYGKRTSSYEYRTTGRGGKGIVAMSVNNRNGKLVASFPVEDSDQIMLVTDGRAIDPLPGRGHPRRRPLDAGRHRVRHRRGRARRLGRAHRKTAMSRTVTAASRPPCTAYCSLLFAAGINEVPGGHPEDLDPEQPGRLNLGLMGCGRR
jgi:hypothetical protein